MKEYTELKCFSTLKATFEKAKSLVVNRGRDTAYPTMFMHPSAAAKSITNSIKMPTYEELHNLQLVAKYFTEYWGKANPDVVDEVCHDDWTMSYPMHGIRRPEERTNL